MNDLPPVNSPVAPSWWDKLMGQESAEGDWMPGYGGNILQGVSAAGNLYLGMKQYGLAKDQLAFQKTAFEKNFENQRKVTNGGLADRQTARVAANPSAYQSVGDYMKQYGV